MREIKFRAWDGEQMRTSFVVHNVTGRPMISVSQGDYMGLEVQDWQLMQFTGLRDKNGKEIYEGDLLQRSDKAIDEVFYRADQAQFMVMQRSHEEIADDVLWGFAGDSEVIGNNYENPELLKV